MFFVLGYDCPRYDNELRALIAADIFCLIRKRIWLKENIHTTRSIFFYWMAWWISFALIHTKAVLLNQSKKGSCMNQSQNAIFTSPAGEENLMNSSHRDSESITGESSLVNIEVLIACNWNVLIQCIISLWCNTGFPFQPPLLGNWINSFIPESPHILSKYALCAIPCLCLTPCTGCFPGQQEPLYWSSYLQTSRTKLPVLVYPASTWQEHVARKG